MNSDQKETWAAAHRLIDQMIEAERAGGIKWEQEDTPFPTEGNFIGKTASGIVVTVARIGDTVEGVVSQPEKMMIVRLPPEVAKKIYPIHLEGKDDEGGIAE